jgi:beta-phosphoglucomutase family hydrolase
MVGSKPGVAVLFDWDGVVIDSSAYHERAWDRLAVEEKCELPPGHFKKGFGKKNRVIIPEILGWTDDPREIARISDRKEAIYRELIRKDGIGALPGAVALVQALRQAGIPRAVGSSTDRLNIDVIMEEIGLGGEFEAIVAAADVKEGKPHPDVFLKAAAALNVEPAMCVVLEDAQVGIEAAQAAGMKVIAVTSTHPAADLSSADWIVDSLEEVTVNGVRQLVAN